MSGAPGTPSDLGHCQKDKPALHFLVRVAYPPMKKFFPFIVIIIALVFVWHLLVSASMSNENWSINPLTDVATLKMPGPAESGITDPQGIAAFEGARALVAVPIAENKLGVYAREYVDLYALLIPYRVTVVDRTGQSTISSTGPTARPGAQDWHVVSVESRITESNEVYTGYSWKLIIRNDSADPAIFDGWVEFQDADGFKLADDAVNLDRSIQIAPASDGVFTGLRDIENTKRVARTVAKIVKH